MKKVLFVAPCYNYALKVADNLMSDLERAGVPAKVMHDVHDKSITVTTENVIIEFWFDDPIGWNAEKYVSSKCSAVFGKKELLDTLTDRVGHMYRVYRPKAYLAPYIISENKNTGFGSEESYSERKTPYIPEVKNVYFNEPATVVIWNDGTKTIVRCQEGDVFSKEVGLALCISKKALGNTPNFNNIFRKWIPQEETVETTVEITAENYLTPALKSAKQKVSELFKSLTNGKE